MLNEEMLDLRYYRTLSTLIAQAFNFEESIGKIRW